MQTMQLKAVNLQDKISDIKKTCCIELVMIERLETSCALDVASAALKYKKDIDLFSYLAT